MCCPYEHTRVKLDGSKHYINASLVQSAPGELPDWRYIATQVRYHSTLYVHVGP